MLLGVCVHSGILFPFFLKKLSEPVILISPATSNLYDGLGIPIPTLAPGLLIELDVINFISLIFKTLSPTLPDNFVTTILKYL